MSLRRISLRDFVIVSSLDLDLSGGFTVLTGETGAGKSIIVGALGFHAAIDYVDAIGLEGKARAAGLDLVGLAGLEPVAQEQEDEAGMNGRVEERDLERVAPFEPAPGGIGRADATVLVCIDQR